MFLFFSVLSLPNFVYIFCSFFCSFYVNSFRSFERSNRVLLLDPVTFFSAPHDIGRLSES